MRATLVAACVAGYVLVDLALRPLVTSGARIIPWYPSAGLGLAALVIAGPIVAPILFLLRFVLVAWIPTATAPGVLPALVQSAGHVAIYTLAAVFVRRSTSPAPGSWRVRDVSALIVAIGMAAIAAAAWSAVPLGGSLVHGPVTARNLMLFAGGDAIGGFIVVPFVLFVLVPRGRGSDAERPSSVYVGSPDEFPGDRRHLFSSPAAERVLQILAVFVAIAATWAWRADAGSFPGYEWIFCFLPLLWIAQREGLGGAAIAIASYGTAWILLSLFVGVGPNELPASQTLLLTLSVAGLLLGAARTAADEGAARYWSLLAGAAEGVWRLGADGRTLYANTRMADILGRPVEEIIGHAASEFIAPESLDAWHEHRKGRAAGQTGTYETLIVRGDGSRAQVIATASAVRSVSTGEIVGSVAMVTDVSEMRQLQTRERSAQQLLQAAFHSANDAIVLFRAADELIIEVNNVWCAMTGYQRQDVIGRSQRDLGLWGDDADSLRVAELLRVHGSVRDFEMTFRRHLPNGTTESGVALLSAHPVVVDGTTYVLATGRDITSERRADQAQAQLRRLEELGRLTGGVAHDFNNLLTVVMAYTQMVRLHLPTMDHGISADLAEIEKACARGADLTKRLLAFSRQQPVDPQPLDLNDSVNKAEGMLTTIIGSRTRLVISTEASLPAIVADPGQVDQVLLNLAVNARDAMPNGGTLEIGTRVVRADDTTVGTLVGPGVLPGTYVELAVRDNGIGMDSATAQRVFEPFFSTKDPTQGTGLGLAVVAGIMRQARGVARVTSAPGQGSTFLIYWPAANDVAPPMLERASSYRPSRNDHSARVLLVEDDESVREIVCRVLEDAGYQTATSNDGLAALDRVGDLVAAGTPPNVVLSDIGMPSFNGYELAERLSTRHPDIPVILMSGHPEHASSRVLPANVVGPVLAKPFDVPTLERAIESAIARSHA